jgi:flagellar hook-basal body complex protein FliE
MPDPIAPLAPLSPLAPLTPGAPTATPAPAEGESFGGALTDALRNLEALGKEADAKAQSLATGEADDVASVAMAVERASLALQLAVQVRDKTVDAYHEIFRMQV